MSLGSFKNVINKMGSHVVFNTYVITGFGMNNQQWLICHKTQPNQIKLNEVHHKLIVMALSLRDERSANDS